MQSHVTPAIKLWKTASSTAVVEKKRNMILINTSRSRRPYMKSAVRLLLHLSTLSDAFLLRSSLLGIHYSQKPSSSIAFFTNITGVISAEADDITSKFPCNHSPSSNHWPLTGRDRLTTFENVNFWHPCFMCRGPRQPQLASSSDAQPSSLPMFWYFTWNLGENASIFLQVKMKFQL